MWLFQAWEENNKTKISIALIDIPKRYKQIYIYTSNLRLLQSDGYRKRLGKSKSWVMGRISLNYTVGWGIFKF